jgi:hypothetical protein
MTVTDIVERLRDQAWRRSGAPKMDAGHTKMLEWEAADEIARLQAALDQALDDMGDDDENGLCVCLDTKNMMRAALEKAKP